MRSPVGTPHDRDVGHVLTEEGGKVWADRDVEGCGGVSQGRGENIRRPQVSAGDEPRDLHPIRAVTRLSCCVNQRGDRVVPARCLAHLAAGRVGRARVEGPVQAAQGTGSQG